MKKIIIVLVLIVCFYLGIKFIPMGTKRVRMGASLVELEVPKFSSIKSECCTYKVTFKTLRGKNIIKKELDKVINSYMKESCNNNTVYYNMKDDITITKYDVSGGFLYSTFTLEYVKGRLCS